jgi:hypothetical protein
MHSLTLAALTFPTPGVSPPAAPAPIANGDSSPVKADADVDATIKVLRDNSSQDKCLESIIDGVVHGVEKIFDEITGPTGDSTVEVLEALLNDVVETLVVAIKNFENLVDETVDGLLKTVSGLLDIAVVLGLVSTAVKAGILLDAEGETNLRKCLMAEPSFLRTRQLLPFSPSPRPR